MQRQFMGLTLTGITVLAMGSAAIAQTTIVPDTTLGPENSVLTLDPPNLNRITGGATRGSNLFHSFSQFAIGPNQTAWFDNSLSIQNILVRVTGQQRSDIDGTLRANGNADLFLLNPNGFVFGPNARLDIGGAFSALTTTQIPLGETAVFSAVAPEQSQLLAIKPNVFFNLTPPRSDIQLEGNLGVKTGQSITLWGDTVRLTGRLNAPGGQVRIFGDRIGLFDQAQINTSGETTGGQVLIGGEYQGQGGLPKATATYISPNAVVRSDALNNGNGGQIIAWSENSTKAYGTFSANGGRASGNGGLIETSSRNALDTTGIQINATAPQGLPGTWLIDPLNVELKYDATKFGVFDPTNVFTPTAAGAVVDIPTIEKSLNDNINVTITTGTIGNQAGNITAKGFGINKKTPGNATLTLQAANDISLTDFGINSDTKDAERQPLAIQLIAGRDINIGGGIQTYGAPLTVQAGQEIKVKSGGLSSTNIGDRPAAPISLTAPILQLQKAGVNSETQSVGSGAAIVVQVSTLTASPIDAQSADGAGINSKTSGLGNAGAVTIGRVINAAGAIVAAADTVTLIKSGINTTTTGRGIGGQIAIQANQINLQASGINNNTSGSGPSGNTDIVSRQLSVTQNSGITSTVTGTGNGGNLNIDVTPGDILIERSGINSRTIGSSGNSGNLKITAGLLRMNQGGGIDTNSGYEDRFEQRSYKLDTTGNAGVIDVAVDRLIATNGSGIRSETAGKGNSGKINLSVNQDLQLINNSNISTGSFRGSTGKGGEIIANVGSLLIGNDRGYKPDTREANSDPTKRAGGFSSSALGTGDAGNIDLTVRGLLNLDNAAKNQGIDRAGIRLSSEQTGKGGTLRLAANQIKLNNTFISVKSAQSTAGDIQITVPSVILLRNASEISATAGNQQNPGDGGNITITTPLIVAIAKENSDITSDAFSGNGGRITINADNLIGIQFRPKATNLSDITASSERGNQGIVTLNTPEIDPSRGLTVLSIAPIDVAQKLDRRCNANDASSSSAFVARGTGGLPANPHEAIAPNGFIRLATLPDDHQARDAASRPAIAALPVEAQSAMRLADGRIQLRSQTRAAFAPSDRSGCFHSPDRS